MDAQLIKTKLIEVLQNVQALSGEECPPIDGNTKPVDSLPKFISKVWPVATGMLGEAIGKDIPCEINIFVDDVANEPRAIDQIVAMVVKIIEDQEDEKAAAE